MTPQRRPATLLLACAAVAALVAAPASAVVPVSAAPTAPAVVSAATDQVVRGSVTGPGGVLWDNVSVAATLVGGTEPAASAITYGGGYELLLAPGVYRIAFDDLSDRVPVQERSDAVTVLADQVAGLDLGAQRLVLGTVTSSVAPSIAGAPHVGSTLTVRSGTWTPELADLEHSWLVGDGVIGEGGSLRLSPAQLGRRIHVETLATRAGWLDGAAHSATVTVGRAPSVVSATGPSRPVRRGRAARVNVVVSDRSGTPVKGTITLVEKGRRLAAGRVSAGTRASHGFVLKGLRPGVHVVVIKWSGSAYALPASDTVRVAVKR